MPSDRSLKISSILIEFYENMKKLDQLTNYQEREGKKATLVIMTTNDLASINTTAKNREVAETRE